MCLCVVALSVFPVFRSYVLLAVRSQSRCYEVGTTTVALEMVEVRIDQLCSMLFAAGACLHVT